MSSVLGECLSIELTVNGTVREAMVEPRLLLVHLLREELGLTGAHVGCVVGRCGACTVVVDGRAAKSCMMLAVQAEGREVMTVEGLEVDGELHSLQEAFWESDAVECGYCTPGMLMAAYSLLDQNPDPSDKEIKRAISGNLCRCTGYVNIIDAIRSCGVPLAGGPEDLD